MRIGIVTFHRAYNCGAMLQAWALKSFLEKNGHVVRFPACNHVGLSARFLPLRIGRNGRDFLTWVKDTMRFFALTVLSIPSEDIRRFRYWRFRHSSLPECHVVPKMMDKTFDCVVFGSDQIWNLNRAREQENDETDLFLGLSLPASLPRIAYAASLGEEHKRDGDLAAIRMAASCMQAVSLREETHCVGVIDKCGRSAKWVIDPTLLHDRHDYLAIECPKRLVRGRYVLVYIAKSTNVDIALRVGNQVARSQDCRCVCLYAYHYGRWRMSGDDVTAFGPSEFLAFVRDASAVVSCSFHGTAFSLVYHKPFVSVVNEMAGVETRQGTILRRLNCLERYVTPETSGDEWLSLLQKEPNEGVYEKIEEWKIESKAFLAAALQKVSDDL